MAYLLNRQALAAAGVDQQTIEALAKVKRSAEQSDETLAVLAEAPVVLLGANDALTSGRILAAGEGLEQEDGGAGGQVRLLLADTGVDAGTYGAAGALVGITLDHKGRVMAIQTFPLVSDNVEEGADNLYFTQSRARAALSGGAGISYDNSAGTIAVDASVATLTGAQTLTNKTLGQTALPNSGLLDTAGRLGICTAPSVLLHVLDAPMTQPAWSAVDTLVVGRSANSIAQNVAASGTIGWAFATASQRAAAGTFYDVASGRLYWTAGAQERAGIDASGNVVMGGSAVITASRHPVLRSYTVATLPTANPAGQMIYVSNATGGAVPAYSDGTNWRRVTDMTIIN